MGRVRDDLLAQYEKLLSELHGKVTPVRQSLERLTKDSDTIVMCLWKDGDLLATAEASLIFPAGVPTVYISDVVVLATARGKGYGQMVMCDLMRCAEQRWCTKYGQLSFFLTSRDERGTRGFYEGLGFVGVGTNRYVK